MPELLDRPRTQKFNFPGVYDRSLPPQAVIVPQPEETEDASEPVVKPRAPRKKLEPKAEVSTSRKQLKLGKAKH